ncbi:M20/M25/M40 family metallo-hydrolase [Microbacterium sp. 2FI]|uniref:M20/M25/M40 family metallo-hydrolase n=1 Tax=Microbacterium sp. 2FI TaxID=2502193 RepID=UPI0010F922FF|nr:M20/M25/M40 family metallo-hydrolase [Microbacterium sp. 2FI]
MVDQDATIALAKQLIEIDSVNPELVPGGAGEAAIAQFAAEWLSVRGFACRLLEQTPGRPSILAIADGTGQGTSIMLNGHLDTVALSSYEGKGLEPVERDGKLYGRGAYDMKSGVAAIMIAAAAAASRPHAGDIVVALVADEEWASGGTAEVLRHIVTDCAIVVEPSGLDLVIAHRGFVWANVTIHGTSAHGSRPDLGVDAIAKAGRFLTAIDHHGRQLATSAPHPMLGTGSIHVSTISGGTEASTYPAECSMVIERRTIPGEDDLTTERELRGLLEQISSTDSEFRFDVQVTAHRPPFAAANDSVIAGVLASSIEDFTGESPLQRGEAFWTDCALLSAAGIDTVLFGVDGGGAHAASEWVSLASLDIVTAALELAIVRATS